MRQRRQLTVRNHKGACAVVTSHAGAILRLFSVGKKTNRHERISPADTADLLTIHASESWRQEHGPATPESTNIIVRLHPDSDPVIAKVLASNGEWAKGRGAQLQVEMLAQNEATE